MTALTFINNQQTDCVTVQDRGLLYGDGLFETMLSCHGKLALWNHHIARLQDGCERLAIPPPAQSALRHVIDPQLDSHLHQIIKIVVTRGATNRGYRMTKSLAPNIIISITEREFRPPAYWSQGIALFSCRTRLAKQPILAGIKHLNRLEQVLAAQEWGEDYQEGLMCTDDEDMIEGTSHNIFFVKNGALFTPDLSQAGVAGVMRHYVIELARRMQLPVYIKCIQLSELTDMDEVFVTNSIDGILPVRRIGDTHFQPGKLTRALQAQVAELIPYQ